MITVNSNPQTMSQRFRSAATSVALITIVAVALRAGFLLDYASHNSHHALGVIPFLFESGNIAVSLATGHGFSSPFRVDTGPTAWTTPVYPGIIAGIFGIFGTYTFAAFLAACAVNILATGLACVPIFYTGKRIRGVALGAGAAWLWAVFPNAIEIPSTSMWDASLAALLAATILWATIALAQRSDGEIHERKALSGRVPWNWIGYGLLWGLAVMTTATLIGLFPFLVGWIVCRSWKRNRAAGRRGMEWLTRPVITLVVMILCCVPWTIRNYKVFHAFVPMRSILGLQLWVGNNPQAKPIWLGTQHPIHDSAELAEYIQMGEIAYMKQKEHDALAYMATHPSRDAYLGWKRFLEFWSGGTPTPLADLFRSRSAWFDFVLLFNLLAGIGALAGIIVLGRERSAYWVPLATFPIVFPWAYYLTVVMPRYGLPIDPAVMLLTAAAIGAVATRKSRARSRASVAK
ncbi:MAG TPA: hypothetical protein VMF66_10660 [Candidatus Acidoferrum sp.]|nr:hypothetical protein [Candidatus Acidoferrum sp.]